MAPSHISWHQASRTESAAYPFFHLSLLLLLPPSPRLATWPPHLPRICFNSFEHSFGSAQTSPENCCLFLSVLAGFQAVLACYWFKGGRRVKRTKLTPGKRHPLDAEPRALPSAWGGWMPSPPTGGTEDKFHDRSFSSNPCPRKPALGLRSNVERGERETYLSSFLALNGFCLLTTG